MPLCRYYVSIWARLQHFPVAFVVLWQDQELFVTGKNRESDKQLRARNNGLVGAELTGTHCMCQDSPQIARCCELSKREAQRETRPCMDVSAECCLQRRTVRSVWDTHSVTARRQNPPEACPRRFMEQLWPLKHPAFLFPSFYPTPQFCKAGARVVTRRAENQSGGGLKAAFIPSNFLWFSRQWLVKLQRCDPVSLSSCHTSLRLTAGAAGNALICAAEAHETIYSFLRTLAP